VDERHGVIAVSPISDLRRIFRPIVSSRISSLQQLTLAVMELDTLLIQGGQAVKRSPSTSSSSVRKKGTMDEPYDRSAYWSYAADRKRSFSKLYTFCFALAKPPYVTLYSHECALTLGNRTHRQARNIDMEVRTCGWFQISC
jgi:hypothetical protein